MWGCWGWWWVQNNYSPNLFVRVIRSRSEAVTIWVPWTFSNENLVPDSPRHEWATSFNVFEVNNSIGLVGFDSTGKGLSWEGEKSTSRNALTYRSTWFYICCFKGLFNHIGIWNSTIRVPKCFFTDISDWNLTAIVPELNTFAIGESEKISYLKGMWPIAGIEKAIFCCIANWITWSEICIY